ncbi:ABC transporter ATP-binding protein [Desulfovibrio intestinalis]|uniref:NitT/TauT family transport system ATP-binding protein n=1 Tax=Desulfovibrio intestinalis TaxID=58621 RepID=A0A7W8BZH8_9BACT|nr:ATP-binding cassette domain-containing protein [Desulfovibrio intestinalis]MBB5142108.1 NitT/TauT family transport system ATP-binding protein [Desulfovibrio intestinalis]
MTPLLTLGNVGHRFGAHVVLRGVNFTLEAGKCVVLTGPSGTGKSTLTRIMTGLLHPQEGTVKLNARRVGFVFQEPRLLPWRTALQNVLLPCDGRNPKMKEYALEMLEAVGLANAAALLPEELSGGMRQRVSLARALAVRPDFLVLDEPFTGLDGALREEMKTLIERLVCAGQSGAGMAVVQVAHHQHDILRHTSAQFRLEHGALTAGQGSLL